MELFIITMCNVKTMPPKTTHLTFNNAIVTKCFVLAACGGFIVG